MDGWHKNPQMLLLCPLNFGLNKKCSEFHWLIKSLFKTVWLQYIAEKINSAFKNTTALHLKTTHKLQENVKQIFNLRYYILCFVF